MCMDQPVEKKIEGLTDTGKAVYLVRFHDHIAGQTELMSLHKTLEGARYRVKFEREDWARIPGDVTFECTQSDNMIEIWSSNILNMNNDEQNPGFQYVIMRRGIYE